MCQVGQSLCLGLLPSWCDDASVLRFRVTIEGPNWEDFDEIELPRLPSEGDPIDTKYGTCVVVRTEALPDTDQYAGIVVCRMP